MNISTRRRLFSALTTICLGLAALAAVPLNAQAIQLHWGDGSTGIVVSQDSRVLLVVRADSAEQVLPATWKLIWTADSSGVRFTAVDSLVACDVDTAKVSSIDPPSTPADSAANEVTAHLCSAGAGRPGLPTTMWTSWEGAPAN